MNHDTIGDGNGDAVQTHALPIDDFEPPSTESRGIEAQVEGPSGGGRRLADATFGYQ